MGKSRGEISCGEYVVVGLAVEETGAFCRRLAGYPEEPIPRNSDEFSYFWDVVSVDSDASGSSNHRCGDLRQTLKRHPYVRHFLKGYRIDVAPM